MFDKLNLLYIIRDYSKDLEPKDGKDSVESEYFKHVESGIMFKFSSPAFNTRVSELWDKGLELILYLVFNFTEINNILLSDLDLSEFPYYVADIAIRHFSQKIARRPSKKKLS
jgi:hypothetical protein